MANTFKRNLQRGFGVSIFLLLVTSVASFYSIYNLVDSSKWVDHTNVVMRETENMISSMKDAETAQRGFLITRQPDFLEPYNGSYQRTMEAFKEVKKLTVDNIDQQNNLDSLEVMINKRFNILSQSIAETRQGIETSVFVLRDGMKYMELSRSLVKKIQAAEAKLMSTRTAEQELFATYTPIVIIIASLVSLLLSILFFRQILRDFSEKNDLSQSLAQKDKQIGERIVLIDRIAGEIAKGDYSVRVDADESDSLGSLAGSLNKMAGSLDQSFTKISTREWLQKGVAQLSQQLAGEKDVLHLAKDLVDFITAYTGSEVGAVYLVNNRDRLYVASAYALPPGSRDITFAAGEGLVGEAYESRKPSVVTDIPGEMHIVTGTGSIRPTQLAIFPLMFEDEAVGVLELGKINSYKPEEIELINTIALSSGIILNTAYNRQRLKELLEETQSQSEELQSQHRELENMNAELEVQAEKLQTSEEELKVQQEELLETNQELEERSRSLEEKNHLVVLRNLEIQKKAEELALSTRYKSEFLANMSHELRTPLNSVLLLSRLLSDNTQGNLTGDQVEFAKVIQSSGNGLLELIDEILDLSKIESGKLDLEYDKVKIADIVTNLKVLFEPLAKEKNLVFNVNLAEAVPAVIETDRMRLEQVLKNFISNALKFTTSGSITLDVALADDDDTRVRFAVRDTGIGIPAEKHALVFEAFQQADGSTKRKYGGTGLGLSISRQLAHLLSGTIGLESEPDKGSVFSITVPVYNTGKKTEPLSPAQMTMGIEPEIPVTRTEREFIMPAITGHVDDDRISIDSTDKVLLIVEDDKGFALALLDFARQKGYKGVVVSRGDEVFDAVRGFHPTGILLDVQLPGKDGLAVMDELRSDPRTRSIPVHMMSSFEARKESLESGAVDFITKPISPEQLDVILERIERAMESNVQKVAIVEDNTQHARALEYFLTQNNIKAVVAADVESSGKLFEDPAINCVIIDMEGAPVKQYETLKLIKERPGSAEVPVIIFTGKSLSRPEEKRIRQFADSIIVKTAHSYQRILNEVSLFLHLVEDDATGRMKKTRKLGTQDEVLKDKTVLVADDDVRNIFAITKALESLQMKVIPAMDGREAMSLLESNPSIDIVLMDMMMPELDGYEAITRIRRNSDWKRLPVIAVTAKAAGGDRDKCIQAGASDYISKPVDTDQLVSLMRIWLYESWK
ncbi:MAG: response regulator [Chitinophagaceae bacterium]|nr:MAG: response regulator [Chitinophagaceae bacterium]